MRDHQKAEGQVREMTAMMEHREVVTSRAWETVGTRFLRTLRVTGRRDIQSWVACSHCTRVISGRVVITAGLHENDNRAFWEWQSQNSVDQLFSVKQEKTLSPGGRGESLGSTCLLLQAFRTSQASFLSMLTLCTCSPYSPEVLSHPPPEMSFSIYPHAPCVLAFFMSLLEFHIIKGDFSNHPIQNRPLVLLSLPIPFALLYASLFFFIAIIIICHFIN